RSMRTNDMPFIQNPFNNRKVPLVQFIRKNEECGLYVVFFKNIQNGIGTGRMWPIIECQSKLTGVIQRTRHIGTHSSISCRVDPVFRIVLDSQNGSVKVE